MGRARAPRRRRRARWRDVYLEALACGAAGVAAVHAGEPVATMTLALFAIGWAGVAFATALD
jgi:hypothetical protein